MTDLPERLFDLAPKPRSASKDLVRASDHVAEAHGFIDRTPRRKPGRKKGLRTFQIHPKMLPEVGEQIVAEAERLGTTQGHVIEAMWRAYMEQGKPGPR